MSLLLFQCPVINVVKQNVGELCSLLLVLICTIILLSQQCLNHQDKKIPVYVSSIFTCLKHIFINTKAFTVKRRRMAQHSGWPISQEVQIGTHSVRTGSGAWSLGPRSVPITGDSGRRKQRWRYRQSFIPCWFLYICQRMEHFVSD